MAPKSDSEEGTLSLKYGAVWAWVQSDASELVRPNAVWVCATETPATNARARTRREKLVEVMGRLQESGDGREKCPFSPEERPRGGVLQRVSRASGSHVGGTSLLPQSQGARA